MSLKNKRCQNASLIINVWLGQKIRDLEREVLSKDQCRSEKWSVVALCKIHWRRKSMEHVWATGAWNSVCLYNTNHTLIRFSGSNLKGENSRSWKNAARLNKRSLKMEKVPWNSVKIFFLFILVFVDLIAISDESKSVYGKQQHRKDRRKGKKRIDVCCFGPPWYLWGGCQLLHFRARPNYSPRQKRYLRTEPILLHRNQSFIWFRQKLFLFGPLLLMQRPKV